MNLGEFPHAGDTFVYRFVDDKTVLPCPFCGKHDSSYWAKKFLGKDKVYVASYWECNSCFIVLTFPNILKRNFLVSAEVEIAKEKWNTRVDVE